MTRHYEKKGSDFPSTLVISEKLDFFEIPSKLLEKVLLDIQPSQLVMPSILVSSRKKRLGIYHNHHHYWKKGKKVKLCHGITIFITYLLIHRNQYGLAEAQTLVTTFPPCLAICASSLFSPRSNATSWNCTITTE